MIDLTINYADMDEYLDIFDGDIVQLNDINGLENINDKYFADINTDPYTIFYLEDGEQILTYIDDAGYITFDEMEYDMWNDDEKHYRQKTLHFKVVEYYINKYLDRDNSEEEFDIEEEIESHTKYSYDDLEYDETFKDEKNYDYYEDRYIEK